MSLILDAVGLSASSLYSLGLISCAESIALYTSQSILLLISEVTSSVNISDPFLQPQMPRPTLPPPCLTDVIRFKSDFSPSPNFYLPFTLVRLYLLSGLQNPACLTTDLTWPLSHQSTVQLLLRL